MEETAADVWKELVEAAEKENEEQATLDLEKVKHYGGRLDKYIQLCSGMSDLTEIINWLTVDEKHKMNISFYRRTAFPKKVISNFKACKSPSVTILCYKISERENCLPEDVCKMLIALGLISKKTQVNKSIIGELRNDNGGKVNSSSGQIKEGILNSQGDHVLPENSVGCAESPEDNAECMSLQRNGVDDSAGLSAGNDKCEIDSIEDDEEDVRLDISQYTDKDNMLEITKEALEKFVTKLIGAMSYKIKARFPGERSSYYELLSIYVDEISVFHRGINTWEYVQVTYFASGTADEDIQQEIERLHKMEERPQAFVIVACATDRIFKHLRENIACDDRKNSIMLLCYEHPDEAYICLKKDLESDKKCFEHLKPDSQKYCYM